MPAAARRKTDPRLTAFRVVPRTNRFRSSNCNPVFCRVAFAIFPRIRENSTIPNRAIIRQRLLPRISNCKNVFMVLPPGADVAAVRTPSAGLL